MGDDTLGPAAAGRERQLADAFVELADTLVADYDVLEFLHALAGHCVDLLDVDAAGLMLADRGGVLRVAASSSDDLEDGDGTRWPRFGSEATAAGFRSVLALPLRLRSETIGALNMFRAGAGPLGTVDRSLAQALADVATIGILQERGSQRREVLARQLQEALTSRVVIEQAKGVIAERLGLHVDEAFDLMRSYARSQSEKLSDVADRVVS